MEEGICPIAVPSKKIRKSKKNEGRVRGNDAGAAVTLPRAQFTAYFRERAATPAFPAVAFSR
jgi:hypothetical protein